MGKHLNTLRAAAATGNATALQALERALWVPHHNRPRRVFGRLRTGYSGHSGNPYAPIRTTKGLSITAKTLVPVTTTRTTTVNDDYRMERLQMLKDRRQRRAQREARA
jgi:hypothetical protein